LKIVDPGAVLLYTLITSLEVQGSEGEQNLVKPCCREPG